MRALRHVAQRQRARNVRVKPFNVGRSAGQKGTHSYFECVCGALVSVVHVNYGLFAISRVCSPNDVAVRQKMRASSGALWQPFCERPCRRCLLCASRLARHCQRGRCVNHTPEHRSQRAAHFGHFCATFPPLVRAPTSNKAPSSRRRRRRVASFCKLFSVRARTNARSLKRAHSLARNSFVARSTRRHSSFARRSARKVELANSIPLVACATRRHVPPVKLARTCHLKACACVCVRARADYHYYSNHSASLVAAALAR